MQDNESSPIDKRLQKTAIQAIIDTDSNEQGFQIDYKPAPELLPHQQQLDEGATLENGAGLYQRTAALPASYGALPSPSMTAGVSLLTFPELPWPCLCGRTHGSWSECLESRSFQVLLDAETAIHQNPVLVDLYPRTPSIANLLLLDNESNPVVQVLSQLIKRWRPQLLADSVALYLVMYRLFRVCVSIRLHKCVVR